jgi:hypothetical protein
MVADIKLDDGADRIDVQGGQIDLQGNQIDLQGSQISLQGDRIVLKGRVSMADGRLNLQPAEFQGPRSLPTEAEIGDLCLLMNTVEALVGPITTTSLWICVKPEIPSISGGPAVWRQIQLGDEVISP